MRCHGDDPLRCRVLLYETMSAALIINTIIIFFLPSVGIFPREFKNFKK